MSNPVGLIFRFILKLALGLFAAIFALSLLAAALVVVALSLVKALLTGRKPAPAMVFGRFQKFSPEGMWPVRPGRNDSAPNAAAVVDVEAREVRDDKRLP
ncbi:MAG: hypothetical protein ABIV07_01945 [Polaromonas sp.]